MPKKLRTISVPDYGDEEINRLAETDLALGKMTGEERARALRWFKAKYPADWPSDTF